MKKVLVVLALLGLAHCVNREPRLDAFGTKTFWASQFRSGVVSPVQVPAVFIGSSENAMVYAELKNLVDTDVAANMLEQFENLIAPKEHNLFGRPLDINKDEKISILLLDIDDGAGAGNPSITGYFDPFNQFNDGKVYEATCNNSSTSNCSRSNELEMLYLDVSLAQKNDKTRLYATLAHEYQHVLNFAHDYTLNPSNVQVEATWVNEGLSEVTSDIVGYGPQQNRLDNFSNVRGNSLVSWNSASPLVDYAHTYAYFRFLTDVYGESFLGSAFQQDQLDIAGINAALAALNDADILANCGSDLAPTNTLFDCTYRFMWAALLNISSANGDRAGTATGALFTRPVKFSFNATNIPSLPPAQTANNVVLPAYAGDIFSKTGGASANLASCIGCSIGSFTLFYETAQTTYVVYNHDANSATNTQINVNPLVVSDEEDHEICGNVPVTKEIMVQVSN